MGAILPFFSHNVDVDMYPCIMVDQRSEQTTWLAMPDITSDHHQLTIWGMVHWDAPEQAADAIALLAAAVKMALNQHHHSFPVDELHDLYFEDDTPVTSIEYGVAQMDTALVKAFQASWASRVSVQVRSDS